MIPKYEEIMLPFLNFIADGKEHGLGETHETFFIHTMQIALTAGFVG
jgi:hypothetical protein